MARGTLEWIDPLYRMAAAQMTDELLTAMLAERVMGWRARPDRFLTGDRCWISRSQFRPLVDLNDAFRLLDLVTSDYSLIAVADGTFIAQVRASGKFGKASGQNRARTISLAVAQALELTAGVIS
jgi:hypothetical protein